MLARDLVEQLATALGTNPGLVEKDWHVVRALGILASLDHADAKPVFSGGTSLSKGWSLIKRFSEDIDFKVAMPQAASGAVARNNRRTFRERILSALSANEFELTGTPLIGNQSQFFAADLAYPSHFATPGGLRPHLRIEMSFHAPALKPINRPVQSLIAQAQKQPPEVAAFPCIDPIETAADKLSTLAWRVCARKTRKRGSADDDPAIIRHLHDLAALEGVAAKASCFPALARKTVEGDTGRGGEGVPSSPKERFEAMLDLLHNDKLWASEYETFVLQVSFAKEDERISFAEAFSATRRLVILVSRS
ncbi:MAG: nucleotidyl transferase AbiEii/AbiGii toxin family protein [Syntrophobacteraceae bacterium]|nr:nucleotidyl transferase AbiEii/AbiGii toxin family protein [Syntrophobacteraceae bacterium]